MVDKEKGRSDSLDTAEAGEWEREHKAKEMLKTFPANQSEHDVVQKEVSRWVVNQMYLPSSQEMQMNFVYSTVPIVIGFSTYFGMAAALRRFVQSNSFAIRFPSILTSLIAFKMSNDAARVRLNHRLMRQRTPLGNKMLQILVEYRQDPAKFQSTINQDRRSFIKEMVETTRKMKEQKQAEQMQSLQHTSVSPHLVEHTDSAPKYQEDVFGEAEADAGDLNILDTFELNVDDMSRQDTSVGPSGMDYSDGEPLHKCLIMTINYHCKYPSAYLSCLQHRKHRHYGCSSANKTHFPLYLCIA